MRFPRFLISLVSLCTAAFAAVAAIACFGMALVASKIPRAGRDHLAFLPLTPRSIAETRRMGLA